MRHTPGKESRFSGKVRRLCYPNRCSFSLFGKIQLSEPKIQQHAKCSVNAQAPHLVIQQHSMYSYLGCRIQMLPHPASCLEDPPYPLPCHATICLLCLATCCAPLSPLQYIPYLRLRVEQRHQERGHGSRDIGELLCRLWSDTGRGRRHLAVIGPEVR